MKVQYRWNGQTISRKKFRRRRMQGVRTGAPMVARGASQDRPLESVALSCHPLQVAEFNAMYAAAGITGASHRADGTCVLESRRARNEALKLRGLRDNDAGYGDHAGFN